MGTIYAKNAGEIVVWQRMLPRLAALADDYVQLSAATQAKVIDAVALYLSTGQASEMQLVRTDLGIDRTQTVTEQVAVTFTGSVTTEPDDNAFNME